MKPRIHVEAEDFDVGREIAAATEAQPGVGAVVTFTGRCRDEGGRLAILELEHYPGMAEAELGRIGAIAAERWPLRGLTIIHRYGRLRPGDNIVLVITASEHRQAALEAADFLMDYLKTRAPFWKREHLADGTIGNWIAAKAGDDSAAARWIDHVAPL